MTVIRHTERRRTETPNGIMTTLASPTQGGAGMAMWHVEFKPGRQGPPHAFDTEQIWTFLSGTATIDLGGHHLTVEPGDTVVFPADAFRQMDAHPEDGFTAIVTAPAGTRAYNPSGETASDAGDLAPKATERLTPPWAR
ncbi:cupin domain-containing protein [Spongiactinospora sp. TRM90649]|uniref:cupin domain-containing protein n=1 Tax=Spongiactinospora sp. TRM90649 TaxID=3031114 RepID=UPI0023F80DF0|nr:cupin domain-containing protein [Spongiactinospora sp. TRM90649]MDF5751845.1 cupin domain-containing protein [Spongiactinospora sp. TRM90649]